MQQNQGRRDLQAAALQLSTHNHHHHHQHHQHQHDSSTDADPFNDPSGVLYRAKRSYLRSRGEAAIEPPDQFKTRRQMRLKKIREHGGGALNDTASFAFLNVLKKEDDIMRNPYLKKNKNNLIAKENRLLRNKIVICKYTSDSAFDWIEERQAGCRIWVNRNTGEATSECPFAKEGGGGGGGGGGSSGEGGGGGGVGFGGVTDKRAFWRNLGAKVRCGSDGSGVLPPLNARPNSRAKTPVAETPRGTGALVYDATELSELFQLLDGDVSRVPKKHMLPPIGKK